MTAIPRSSFSATLSPSGPIFHTPYEVATEPLSRPLGSTRTYRDTNLAPLAVDYEHLKLFKVHGDVACTKATLYMERSSLAVACADEGIIAKKCNSTSLSSKSSVTVIGCVFQGVHAEKGPIEAHGCHTTGGLVADDGAVTVVDCTKLSVEVKRGGLTVKDSTLNTVSVKDGVTKIENSTIEEATCAGGTVIVNSRVLKATLVKPASLVMENSDICDLTVIGSDGRGEPVIHLDASTRILNIHFVNQQGIVVIADSVKYPVEVTNGRIIYSDRPRAKL